jgi:hypothetical protein
MAQEAIQYIHGWQRPLPIPALYRTGAADASSAYNGAAGPAAQWSPFGGGQPQEEAMTRTALPASFALGVALALLLPAALPAQRPQPSVEELKRQVAQREEELRAAQAALAAARARLAEAEGKAEVAAAEWRTVLAHAEGRLKAVREQYAQGRICTAEPYQEAQGAVAIARVRLAEAEGKRDTLLAELPKVIAYYEQRVRYDEALSRHKAISEQEAQQSLKESGEELRRARERLAALRGTPASPDKAGKEGKP